MVESLFAFVVAAVLVALAPGPSTVVIMRQSMQSGRRAGAAAVLGNETGVVLWGVAAAFGLSALLVASQVAYDTMRVIGAAVLIYMGARALWQARRLRAHASAIEKPPGAGESSPISPVSGWRSYRLGLLTNFANPKAGVFAVSFLPQFVPHGVPVLPTLVLFSVVWALIDALWYLTLVWLVGRARLVLTRAAVRRGMEQVSGIVLVGLGLRLAADTR